MSRKRTIAITKSKRGMLQHIQGSETPSDVHPLLNMEADQCRRYRTMEAASLRLQKEAKGYLDSLRGEQAEYAGSDKN
jgi:hypothetical protein